MPEEGSVGGGGIPQKVGQQTEEASVAVKTSTFG